MLKAWFPAGCSEVFMLELLKKQGLVGDLGPLEVCSERRLWDSRVFFGFSGHHEVSIMNSNLQNGDPNKLVFLFWWAVFSVGYNSGTLTG